MPTFAGTRRHTCPRVHAIIALAHDGWAVGVGIGSGTIAVRLHAGVWSYAGINRRIFSVSHTRLLSYPSRSKYHLRPHKAWVDRPPAYPDDAGVLAADQGVPEASSKCSAQKSCGSLGLSGIQAAVVLPTAGWLQAPSPLTSAHSQARPLAGSLR